MKDRYVQCKYYLNEGNCEKGHKGTFYRACQKCADYTPLKGKKPTKKNLRKQKIYKILSNKKYWAE